VRKLTFIFFSIIAITSYSQSKPIKKIDELLTKADKVTFINFSYSTQNEVDYLLDRLERFTNLTSLNLINTSLEAQLIIDKRLLESSNLTSLSIGFADLSQCLSQLDKLNKLESLSISVCGLKVIPESIFKLKNLNYLCLDYNEIDSVPTLINNLENLSVLYLKNNRFSVFPTEILSLYNLTELHIGNEYSSPNYQLPGRREISYNRFVSLPDNIIGLKKLKRLFLPKNCKIDNIINCKEKNKIIIRITS
jgi:Leucine-rich repeat (LRR) protein